MKNPTKILEIEIAVVAKKIEAERKVLQEQQEEMNRTKSVLIQLEIRHKGLSEAKALLEKNDGE